MPRPRTAPLLEAALVPARHPRRPERIELRRCRKIARDLAGRSSVYLRAYGGLDVTPIEGVKIFEELARADASVAWCVWNGNTHWTAAQLSPETARTIHADPDVITANSTRTSGQAQIVDGGYRVSGRWSFVSGCELAPGWCFRASSRRTGGRD